MAGGRGAGHHDGQRQRLAGQVEDAGPDVFAEQEHPEQAGRQRIEDGKSGLRGGKRTGRQGVAGRAVLATATTNCLMSCTSFEAADTTVAAV